MLAIETTPPADGTFAHVLRRYDRHLQEHAIAVICYTGHYDSRWIEIDGVKAHTLFVQTPEECDYAKRRGWQDETAEWFAREAKAKRVPAVEKALRSLASPSVASAVAKTAGLPTADVVAILDALEAEGKAVKRGTGAIVLWSAPAPLAAPKDEGALASA
jgi:hypothetical protein